MNTPNTHRITLFESLRGMLSFWVLFAHVGLFTGMTRELPGGLMVLSIFNYSAGFAVYVFMILSGFVISYLLDKGREGYGRFIFRRFFRLYPVFVLAVAIGVFINPLHQYIHSHASWKEHSWIQDQLELAQNDAKYLPEHLLSHSLMLHGAVPDQILPRTDAAFSGPGWSISTEWQFYLLAPFLFLISRRRLGFLAFTAFVVVWRALPWFFPNFHPQVSMRSLEFSQMHWFYLGIAFFFWYKKFAGLSPFEAHWRKIITLSMLVYLMIAPDGTNFWIPIPIWLFFFGLVVWEHTRHIGFLDRLAHWLDQPFLQYFGRISYPIYLLHWPVIIVASRIVLACNPQIDHVAAYVILMVVVPLVTIGVSHVVHHFIEVPGMEFARRFHAPKMKSAAATAATVPQPNEIQRKES